MGDERDWRIAPLSRAHVREGFDCGVPELDSFLLRYARQSQDRGISRTYVATRSGDRKVLGYFTLSGGAVEFRDLPEEERRHLPKYPVPVVHLGRLAVDRRLVGPGLGAALLVEALRIALGVSETVGAFAIEVVAKSETARSFTTKHGFASLEDDRRHLYLPMKTLRRAFAARDDGDARTG